MNPKSSPSDAARAFFAYLDLTLQRRPAITMVPNPITEEIRDIRHRLAEQFDNDVYRIGAELRRRQAASSRRFVRLPSRKPVTTALNKSVNPSGTRSGE
jgi:hypothetical protein